MTTNLPISIPLSKGKLLLSTLGAFAFVSIGFWFVLTPSNIDSSFLGSAVIIILGIFSILLFGGGSEEVVI